MTVVSSQIVKIEGDLVTLQCGHVYREDAWFVNFATEHMENHPPPDDEPGLSMSCPACSKGGER